MMVSRPPGGCAARGPSCGVGVWVATGPSSSGSRMVKVEPWPGSLEQVMAPRCWVTMP